MTDRIEKFVEKFEAATETRAQHSDSKRTITAAVRQLGQLADLLAKLGSAGVVTTAVTPDDLRALCGELAEAGAVPQLATLIADAKAVLTVIEEGLVDGDADRLRDAVTRAEQLDATSGRAKGARQARLTKPVRVRCCECNEILVGRRRNGAVNWNAVTQQVRNHERDVHGGSVDELRAELRQAHERLDSGEQLVAAGRCELGQF